MKKFFVAFLMLSFFSFGLMAQTAAPQAVKASDATVVAQDAAAPAKACSPDGAKSSCCSATRTGGATSAMTTTTTANTVTTEAAPKSCCAAKGKGEQAGANGSCQSVSVGMSAKKPE